jgi:molecular chaperone DnaK
VCPGDVVTPYTLAIDFGTTWTAAAVHSDRTVTRLDFAGETRLPSLIWIDDDGKPLVGQAALHQYAMAPERLLAEPKANLGQLEWIVVSGQRHKVSELVGAVLAHVVEEARDRQGDDPAEVTLTHPARWGERRKQALTEAAASAGISAPKLISEPEAAALWLASKLDEGECLAVYDLGGGTFDTAVLERTSEGFALRGEPGGDEYLGGERFDDRLLQHVGAQIASDHPEAWEHLQKRDSPGWAKRATDLRADVRKAKEALSHAEQVHISVPVGGDVDEQALLIRRSELEELIEEDVRRSYDLLDETIARAELKPGDLQGIYLTGGSSHLRRVRDLGRQRYPNLQIRDDPKSVVALGAAGAQRLAEAMTVEEKAAPGAEEEAPPVGPEPPPVAPPPIAPPPVAPPPTSEPRQPVGGRSSRGIWIAVIATAVIAIGGGAVALSGGGGSSGGGSSSGGGGSSGGGSSSGGGGGSSSESPSTTVSLPGKSCGEDLSANESTSCPFARNVRDAYDGSDTLEAYSPVTGQNYTMDCSTGDYTTCAGGNNAEVYFP